jgi:hypothetical protein
MPRTAGSKQVELLSFRSDVFIHSLRKNRKNSAHQLFQRILQNFGCLVWTFLEAGVVPASLWEFRDASLYGATAARASAFALAIPSG